MKVSSLDKGTYVVRLLSSRTLHNHSGKTPIVYKLFKPGDVLLLIRSSYYMDVVYYLSAHVDDVEHREVFEGKDDYSKIFEILDLTKKGERS